MSEDYILQEINYYNKEGVKYYNDGDYYASLDCFKKSLEKSKIFSRHKQLLISVYNLAFCYEKIADGLVILNDCDLAYEYYSESLKLINFCKSRINNKKDKIKSFIERVSTKKYFCE